MLQIKDADESAIVQVLALMSGMVHLLIVETQMEPPVYLKEQALMLRTHLDSLAELLGVEIVRMGEDNNEAQA